MINFDDMTKEELGSWIGKTIYYIAIYDNIKQLEINYFEIDAFTLRDSGNIRPAYDTWDGLIDEGDDNCEQYFEFESDALEYCNRDEYFDYSINKICND